MKNYIYIIILKNERNNIGKCVGSIKGNNVVIIDCESTDQSFEEARKYTDKVFSFHFTDSFAEARNFAISKCDSEWIFFLDADEKLSPNAEDEIMRLIESKNIDGYWFPRRNFINDSTYLKYGYFYPDYQLRLFRNKKEYRYQGKIHEHLTIPKERTKKVDSLYLLHNSSHTKYGSFFHISRLFPYIKVEGIEISDTKINTKELLVRTFIEPLRHFYLCFFTEKGYRDGFAGFRAAWIWGFYEGAKYGYALIKRVP